ncbi:Hypothetical protein POVR2_LOCUS280 [uncultured virus]|nr:Hypothetical protein POVR2_LOCUS280 [uncultured virus]
MDSDIDLYALLERTQDRDVARAILHDNRIRVEKLSMSEAQRLHLLVDSRLVKTVRKSNEETIEHYLSSNDTYSLVLRYLLFKKRVASDGSNYIQNSDQRQRSGAAMLDWLTATRLDGVAEAAASTLDASLAWKEDIAPLRALFISLLYRKLDFLSILASLKAEGYSESQMSKSITLLNLAV